MTIINCTPHTIVITGGPSIPASGTLARVTADLEEIDKVQVGAWFRPVFSQTFGEITGLPEPRTGVYFIVSAIVLQAAKAQGRTDCLAPATGHPDTVRNEKGHIVSVPGFVN